MALAILKEEKHLRVDQYLGARELLHPWDPKEPLPKITEPTSAEKGWSQERRPQRRPGEVM